MAVMIIGLLLFLGAHSVRIVADDWRTATIARVGPKRWKLAYALVSVAGLVLLIWGYGLARHDPLVLWSVPRGMSHLAALLTLVAFVLFAAAEIPRNAIKARLHHPMVLGVKVWAIAHLLANQTLADVVLFGSFLVWAVLDFRAARQRDRIEGTVYPAGTAPRTMVTVVAGILAWAAFAFWLHGLLIGVRPFG
jgi:uncharacterized membrane protein